ncbi:MAG: hypothetical protein AAF639_17985 [Chloroflexota bacterium]
MNQLFLCIATCVLAGLLGSSCDQAEAQEAPGVLVASEDPATASATEELVPAPRLVGGAESTTWWARMGVMTGATCSLSPVLRDSSGQYVRLWTLVCMRPGTPAPLGSLQGSVPLDSSDVISVETAMYSVELQPKSGLTWGEVHTGEDFNSVLVGMD